MALQKAVKENMAQSFKFEKAGDTLKGYFVGKVDKVINGAPAVEHTYRTSTGLRSVLGQANILNQFKNNNITPGTYVEITFSGQMQRLKSGRTMKVYDVSFDPENVSTDLPPVEDTSTLEADDFEESDDSEDSMNPPEPVAAKPQTPSPDRHARMQAILNKTKKVS